MKKLFTIVLAAAAMVACTNDELVSIKGGDAIAFGEAFLDNATRVAEDPSTTKDNITGFNVWAFMDSYTGVVFDAEEVTGSTTAGWTYTNTQYWAPSHTYYFAALSPVDGNWEVAKSTDGDAAKLGLGKVTFENIDGSEDLIYAKQTVTTANDINQQPDAVKLNFKHLLSKVKFTFENGFSNTNAKLVVKDITMTAPKKATIDLAVADYSKGWVLDATEGAETYAYGDLEATLGVGDKKESAKERLTIPTADTYEYTVNFTVELYMGEVLAQTFTETSVITGVELEQGKAYNFFANLNPTNLGLYPIEFEVEEVAGWVPAGDVEMDYIYTEETNTYLINTAEGFQYFADMVNAGNAEWMSANIVLNTDIDLTALAQSRATTATEWTPMGKTGNGNFFTGTFDGNGHTISNFQVTTQEGHAGLFGYARATFKNLNVEDVMIKANHYAGAIVGQGYCRFDNCHVKNIDITLTTKNGDLGDKAGGIIGQNCEGSLYIKNCSAEDVTIKGYRDLGGIAGMAHNSNIVSGCSVENVEIIPDLSVHYEPEIPTTYGGVVGRVGTNVVLENNTEDVIAVAYAAAVEYADKSVKTYDTLEEALADAEAVKVSLFEDVQLADNYRLVVETGKELTINLGGKTLSSNNTTTNTHNFLIDVKGGTLNISKGAVEYTHTGNNMGWNGATTIIDVTNGGVLNLDGVKVINNGGTDMNFAVHMNNWGDATVNADNCSFEAPYCGFRVFNSGPQMNNVTISNSTFTGNNRAFWVHNYASADFGGKLYSGSKEAYDVEKVKARLNFNIIGKGNTYVLASESAISPIRYGFNTTTYIDPVTGEEMNVVSGATSLPTVEGSDKKDTNFQGSVVLGGDLTVSAGETNANSGYGATGVKVVSGTVLDGKGNTLTVNDANATWDCVVAATGGTVKNLTVKGAMRGIFMPGADGDLYIDNVIFDDVIYTFNSDAGNKNYGVYISNCTINGWTSHSDVHKEVVYTECSFGEGNGYAFCRPYGPTKFVGCDFEAGFEMDTRGTVTFENCTIGGVALTAENLATLVISNIANASVK